MYARVTKYRIKADRRDEARTLLNELGAAAVASAGVFQFINLDRDDGAGVLVAIYQTQEDAERAADRVKAAWEQLSHLLVSPPESEGYDVSSYDLAVSDA